ncbi:MAG: acyl-ACP--UDP-N-acetylglucosamine O-acyltransferase [Verrucomicrobiales bacterium]|nr:acyl-ACP--UDP-N-acetylglucosamine O-acyltransferase [Verrucomicrobiales bacterium]
MAIHATAVIDPQAELHPTVEVGPYAVIEAGVHLGEGCRVGPYVHLSGVLLAGARNTFGTGAVVGGAPQDLRFAGGPTRIRMGDDNCVREHVTVHRSNCLEEDTIVGSRNLLMAHCHLGHNAQIGNRVIIANGAQLGGHVVVEDRAFLSANCLVHQFVRIGTLSLMQGGSGISKDLPPYCIARGANGVCGLNVVGLRRAGLEADVRLELRRLYRILYRSGKGLKQALAAMDSMARSDWGRLFVEFVRTSRRGIVSERVVGWHAAEDGSDE